MAADTTYDQLMDETRRLIDQEENHLAEVQKSRLQSLLESLAGVLTDPRNLGRAADLDEAQRTYAKEIQKFLDQLQSFRDGLQRDHGGMHDAHQDAPVSGAQPGFYEG